MLRDRALAGYVAARSISQVGSEITHLGLPWFVLTAGVPLGNAPITSVSVVRTPAQLRAKVSTPTTGANALAAPLALVAARPLVEATDVRVVLAIGAAGLRLSGLAFAAVALRHSAGGLPEAA
jgi:hypothetical protein